MTEDSVELFVFGVKAVLKKPVTRQANLDLTWYEFLNNVCGVEVGPQHEVIVATTSYIAGGKRGWCADLSEKIRIFIDKFAVKKEKYSVRLATKDGENPEELSQRLQSSEANSGSKTNRKGASPAKKRRRHRSIIGSRRKRAVRRRPAPAAQQTTSRGQFVIEGNVEVENDYFLEDSVDNTMEERMEEVNNIDMSNSTSEEIQHNDLRRSRVRRDREIIGPIIKRRFERFSNAFCLRARDEMKKLENNQLWHRNVIHAPLCSYLLQELFAS